MTLENVPAFKTNHELALVCEKKCVPPGTELGLVLYRVYNTNLNENICVKVLQSNIHLCNSLV